MLTHLPPQAFLLYPKYLSRDLYNPLRVSTLKIFLACHDSLYFSNLIPANSSSTTHLKPKLQLGPPIDISWITTLILNGLRTPQTLMVKSKLNIAKSSQSWPNQQSVELLRLSIGTPLGSSCTPKLDSFHSYLTWLQLPSLNLHHIPKITAWNLQSIECGLYLILNRLN